VGKGKHDLLWAGLVLVGFAIAFGLGAFLHKRAASDDHNTAAILAEVGATLQAGDAAAAGHVSDFIAARENYQRALDLLTPLEDDRPDLSLTLRLRIARTFQREGNFARAREDCRRLQQRFPASSDVAAFAAELPPPATSH
jgi:enoyl-CoA hydratase/carnithine racemase